MRVAMVVQRFRPAIGGAERQIERLAPLLAERGVAVTVITRRLRNTAARERLDGLEIIRVPVPRGQRGASIAYTLGGVGALVRLRPDVVHVHGLLSPATIGMVGSALIRKPAIAKILASGPRGSLDRLLAKPMGQRRLRQVGRRFRAVVTLAEESDRELLAHGVPRRLLVRIPNAVDATIFRPAHPREQGRLRSMLELPSGPIALYCGRLEAPKRVDRLVEAFGRARVGNLLIVGGGSEEERIRELAANPEFEGRIILRPPVDDTAPLYRASDVYLSASVREGMSGSVLEAMASGICVAAVPAGGMTELLDGGAGTILPEDDTEQLAAAIQELMLDPARRERQAARARARVESRYSRERVADELVDLYRLVASTNGGKG
jgi:glycosyltransferase involved in cell wall biosynthesis